MPGSHARAEVLSIVDGMFMFFSVKTWVELGSSSLLCLLPELSVCQGSFYSQHFGTQFSN